MSVTMTGIRKGAGASESFDKDRVKEYLQSNPHPSIETLNKFEPNNPNDKDAWNEFLESDWDYKLRIFKDVGYTSGDIDGLEKVMLKDLGVRYIDNLVELEISKVAHISDITPYPAITRFVCLGCKEEYEIPNNIMGIRPKCTCSKPNIIENTDRGHDLIDSQYLKLQEIGRPIGRAPVVIASLLKGTD